MSSNSPATASKSEDDFATLSDSELVQLICQGNIEALLHLVVDRCGGVIRKTANLFRYDGDLSHEICVLLFGRRGDWAKLKTFEGTSAIEGWVKRVGVRICLTQYREKKKQRERFERLPDEGDQIPECKDWSSLCELDRQETRSRLLRAVDKLEPRDREIILIHCLGDPSISSDDMAETLGVLPGAYRTAKKRAIDRLREILKKEEGNDHD